MNGDARRAEREAAYAKNPDQPIVKRAQPSGHGGSAGDPAGSGAAHRRPKPVPVLLQKRKAPETESA